MTVEMIPCSLCGEDISADATFCRHCGSSDSDGWKDEHDQYGDQPDFDYDEYIRGEFPDQVGGHYTNQETKPIWRLVAVVLLLLFLFGYVFL